MTEYEIKWLGFETKIVSKRDRIIEATASSDSADFVGDVVEQDALINSWEKDYHKFPTVRLMHEANAVGRILSVRKVKSIKDGDEVKNLTKVRVYISKEEEKVWTKIQEGVYGGMSIGFYPRKYEDIIDEKTEEVIGKHFIEIDWVETSVVDIPCNRDAAFSVSLPVEDVTMGIRMKGLDEIMFEKLKDVDAEEEKKFNCECPECGHKLQTDKHCRDIKCPKCGVTMRREERPGPGKDIESSDNFEEQESSTLGDLGSNHHNAISKEETGGNEMDKSKEDEEDTDVETEEVEIEVEEEITPPEESVSEETEETEDVEESEDAVEESTETETNEVSEEVEVTEEPSEESDETKEESASEDSECEDVEEVESEEVVEDEVSAEDAVSKLLVESTKIVIQENVDLKKEIADKDLEIEALTEKYESLEGEIAKLAEVMEVRRSTSVPSEEDLETEDGEEPKTCLLSWARDGK